MSRLPSLALLALLTVSAGGLLASAAGAQGAQPGPKSPDPVRVTAKGPTEAVPAGGRFDVVLEVQVDAPYHIYAHDSPGGMPTRIEAAPAEGEAGAGLSFVRVVQPEAAAREHYDSVLEETHRTLEGAFEFRAEFAVSGDAQPGAREVSAKITYMACDAKGCLFPVERPFTLPVTIGAPQAEGGDTQGGKPPTAPAPLEIVKLISSVDPVHLELKGPSKTVDPGSTFEVVLEAQIDAPFHLFAHDSKGEVRPTRVEAAVGEGEAGAGLTIERIVQPDTAVAGYDPVLKEVRKTLAGTVEFKAVVAVAADARPGERTVSVTIDYQACSAAGCRLPVTTTRSALVKVRDPAVAESDSESASAPTPTSASRPAGDASSTLETRLTSALARGDVGGLLWLSLVFGFVSLLTPCVFPMIPITISFFSKRATEAGGRGTRFALAYGLGIMATYTGFGMAMAALLGASSLQALATDPWANLAIGALFVFFGLSLMGFYDLRPPAFLVRRAEGGAASRPGYAPVFVMGFIFTITAFTCTAPIVGSLLAALAGGGSPLLIALGMLVYSAAFALPFVLLAAFPGMVQALPGAGGWMVTLKAVLGFIELVAALKFLSNTDLVWDLQLLTRPVMLAVTLLLVGALAAYLLGAYRLPHDTPGRLRLLSTRGLVAGAVLLAFLYLGQGLIGKELDSWTESYLPPRGYGADASAQPAEPIAWIEDYQAGLAAAAERGVPAFIDFTGITCTNCRIVEKTRFRDPRFAEASRRFVMIKLFTDRQSAEHKPGDLANQQLMASFGSVTLPLYVLLGPDGKVRNTMGYNGSFTVDDYIAFLETPGP